MTMELITARLSVQFDAPREEVCEVGVQVSARSCQMSLSPVTTAKTSGLKLSSWVFDATIAKDCGYARVKVAGTDTCSSAWISMDQEQRHISDQCGGWACEIFSKKFTRYSYLPSTTYQRRCFLQVYGCVARTHSL